MSETHPTVKPSTANGIVPKTTGTLAELATQINVEHEQAQTAFRSSMVHARTAGQLLLQAKEQCQHGEWLPWLAKNVAFSDRTARAYMTVARKWDELAKRQRVANLSFRDGLKLLAEASTRSNKRDVAEVPDVYLPELTPGRGYTCEGYSAETGGEAWAEIDPHPQHPGYWAFAFYFAVNARWWFAEYCGRGCRLDDAKDFGPIMERMGFVPDGPWQADAADPLPQAVQFWKEDFKRRMREIAIAAKE